MPRTISVAKLGQGGASRAVREAQEEPVLVSRQNRPAAWLVSAEQLARIAAQSGQGDMYQHTLRLVATALYCQGTLTLGQAARLAGLALSDFIDLCGRLRIPILWESEAGVARDIDALAALEVTPITD
jgi:predicted HTH domain antitoxin